MRELIISRVKVGLIAKKLKRSPGAVYARINSLKKPPRDLALGRQPRSLPSERLAYAKAREQRGRTRVNGVCVSLVCGANASLAIGLKTIRT